MDETPRALQAYGDYLALGATRSLLALVERYQSQTKPGPPTRLLSTLKGWSASHQWQARVMAHERALQAEDRRRADQERLDELAKRRALQMALAVEMQKHGIEAVRRHSLAGTINAGQAVALLREGAALLFKALGAPDLSVAHDIGIDLHVDLSTLSDEELEERRARLRLLISPHQGA
jgi:hypothetical protein